MLPIFLALAALHYALFGVGTMRLLWDAARCGPAAGWDDYITCAAVIALWPAVLYLAVGLAIVDVYKWANKCRS